MQVLGSGWTDSNPSNRPTHRSGEETHVEYDHIFYTSPSLVLRDFSIQPTEFDQLISHAFDQRSLSPPPFFSDHSILRCEFEFS
jgi:hypothetical protein